MTLWVLLTVMLTVAAAIVGATFQRRRFSVLDDRARTLDAHRAQLAEIDRQERDGVLDAEEAQAARLEAQRRMLSATERAGDAEPGAPTRFDRFAIVATLVVLIGGSVALYALVGSPRTPAAPRGGGILEALNAPRATADAARTGSAQTAPSVEDMIARVRERVEANPDDLDSWSMLGWSLFRTERYAEAADAYARAVALDPTSAAFLSARGEALVMAASGDVTDEAAALFDAARAIDPGDERSRYYQAMATEQGGDAAGAVSAWLALLESADPAAPWAPDVRARVRRLAEANTIALPAEFEAAAPADGFSAAAPRGPSAADVRAAADMTPQDRQAMIQSMVESLDARLAADPSDQDGWLRLIRSRLVLGQEREAQDALSRALAAFADDPAARSFIASGAEELGLRVE